MFKELFLSFFTFFITTWVVTYLIALFVRTDLRIHRPLRTSIAISLFISFIGMNINLTPLVSGWINTKIFASKQASLSSEEVLKMKNEFLTNLDQLVAKPEQITPQNRNELFQKYSMLFPQPQQDLTNYFNNISRFYDCQQSFFEDALQAMKTKKTVKSERRKACQEADGSFFVRQTLIPAEQSKSDDEVISTLAKGKKVVREGKELTITQEMLQQNIARQQKNKEVLRALFTGGN